MDKRLRSVPTHTPPSGQPAGRSLYIMLSITTQRWRLLVKLVSQRFELRLIFE